MAVARRRPSALFEIENPDGPLQQTNLGLHRFSMQGQTRSYDLYQNGSGFWFVTSEKGYRLRLREDREYFAGQTDEIGEHRLRRLPA